MKEEKDPQKKQEPAGQGGEKAGQAPAQPAAAGSETVLVIDDDPSIVKLLKSRLEHHGYYVLTAEDGEQGYEVIKSKRPDLIISDILMPKMTGYDLLQKLKKETDGTQNIPVLILTAKGSMKDFFSKWEIHAFMVKPVAAEDLIAKIEELLRVARLRRKKEEASKAPKEYQG